MSARSDSTFPIARLLSAAAVAFALGLSACTSVELDKNKDAGAQTDPNAGAIGTTDPNAGVSGIKPVETMPMDPLNDPNSPLAKRSIFFQFDSFVVQPEFQSVVADHAKYLTANRNRKVMIEGNTDESGSREYNLALGQKRADAVRRALATLGVEESQMESISFGEEKPRNSGGDEAAMAENRRADLNYR